MRRAAIIVIDSCGAGAAPDASRYGDQGSDTLGHVAEAVRGLHLPNLQAAGLGNLHPSLAGVPPADQPSMGFGRMAEASAGKDSTTGHWEIAGMVTEEAFATFPEGFPEELTKRLEQDTGHCFIGNRAASGTVIIEELGRQHLDEGCIILYTSADSVLQLAAHKSVVPLEELYRVCEAARQIADEWRIGRVIARPFEGELGSFRRTYQRHDYAMPPPEKTLLDTAMQAGLRILGVGKIHDLFAGRGLTDAVHTEGDADGLERTVAALKAVERGIIFTNLVDLDMRYGHREDPAGYAQGLQLIDGFLPRLLEALDDHDVLFITADHGNDPTDGDTDHTRELVPLLVHGARAAGVNLGDRSCYCDVAATVSEGLRLPAPARGTSFWAEIT
ncbi:MAG: phosphopentomutase [Actinomycetota bacterium]|nr:phosphopentomutase [Actinomycetota bacterium]